MRRALALIALAALACLAASASAHAAEPGVGKLRVGTHVVRSLGAQNAKLRRLAPATRRGRVVTLPVRGGEVGSYARVRLGGGLRFVARKGKRRRNARLRGITATIQAGKALLTAKLAGTQYTFGRLRGVEEVPFNPITGEVYATGQLRLDGALRRELRRRLGLRRVPKAFGRLRLVGTLDLAPPTETEPELLERPETAVDVTGAQLEWRLRESFVCYLHAGTGPGVSAWGGAELEPPVPYPPAHLSAPCTGTPPGDPRYTGIYEPESFAEGWFDPVTGAASVRMSGSVRFQKTVFNLDVGAHDPIVEIAPGGTRLIHDYIEYWKDPDVHRLAVTGKLGGGDVVPTAESGPEGVTYTYERVPLVNPSGTEASPLARYYKPGDPYGWFTLSFTVPEVAE